MTKGQYRALFLLLGAAGVAVVVVAFLYGSPEGEREPLPAVLENISPQPGSQVPRQTAVEVDLPVGYGLEIFPDDSLDPVPESEVRFVEGTGVYSWSPSDSSIINWDSGEHRVRVRWRRLSGLADEGEYSWTFRVF